MTDFSPIEIGLLITAIGSLVVLALVLLLTDVHITQSRRIQRQVARDRDRISHKTLNGWSAERIAKRYPSMSPDHIRQVRHDIARHLAANQEVQLLKSMWSASESEPSQGQ